MVWKLMLSCCNQLQQLEETLKNHTDPNNHTTLWIYKSLITWSTICNCYVLCYSLIVTWVTINLALLSSQWIQDRKKLQHVNFTVYLNSFHLCHNIEVDIKKKTVSPEKQNFLMLFSIFQHHLSVIQHMWIERLLTIISKYHFIFYNIASYMS